MPGINDHLTPVLELSLLLLLLLLLLSCTNMLPFNMIDGSKAILVQRETIRLLKLTPSDSTINFFP